MADTPQNMDWEKRCDVCADVGFAELLHICSKCYVSCEHSYCMAMLQRGVIEGWICEECNLVNKTLFPKPVSGELPGDRWPKTKIKHPPISSKVKYISPEEVIGLVAGSNKLDSESKQSSVSNPARSPVCMLKRGVSSFEPPQTLGHNSTLPCGSSPSKPNHMLSKDRKGSAAPPTPIRKVDKVVDRASSATSVRIHDSPVTSPAHTYTLGQTIGRTKPEPALKSLSFKAAAPATPVEKTERVVDRVSPTTSFRIHDLPVSGSVKNVPVPLKSLKNLDKVVDRLPSVASSTIHGLAITSPRPRGRRGSPATIKRVEAIDRLQLSTSLSMHDEPVGISGFLLSRSSYPRNMIFQGREQKDPPLRFLRCLPNHPALNATWRGNFRIIGDASGRFDEGFRAHPPSKVHVNAYEFSKQMPEVLTFEFCPRWNFWGNIFEDDAPGGLDIGLYFFPRAARVNDKYALLVEHLEMHDFVLRSCVGEVELLIITSKHLHGDSQRINGGYFLWGFFRERATKEAAFMETTSVDDGNIVDMDIGMEGGEKLVKDHSLNPSNFGQSVLNGHQSPSSETCEAIDMEVDMIGGRSVGKVEVFVPRPSQQRNLTGQPLSKVKSERIKGPSPQENRSWQLLSQVKNERIEEDNFSPQTILAAVGDSTSKKMPCKTISKCSPLACNLQTPPGFTEADKLIYKKNQSIKAETSAPNVTSPVMKFESVH